MRARDRNHSRASAATTATSNAVHTGEVPNRRPAPTPATATWPIPSPSNDRRFCTRNVPMRGADAPTASPAISASCMYVVSNGHGSGHGIPGITSRRSR